MSPGVDMKQFVWLPIDQLWIKVVTTIPAVVQIETRSNTWDKQNPRKKLFISLVQFCLHCTVYTGCTLYIVQLLLLNKCYICGDSICLSPKSSYLQVKNLTFSSLCIMLFCKVGKLWIPYIIFRNTDSDEAVTVDGDTRTLVSVTREGGFFRSGPEVADEVTFALDSLFCLCLNWMYRLRCLKERRTSWLWTRPTIRSSTAPTCSTTTPLTPRSAG